MGTGSRPMSTLSDQANVSWDGCLSPFSGRNASVNRCRRPARSGATGGSPARFLYRPGASLSPTPELPARLTISFIQIGAKGEVQPLGTG